MENIKVILSILILPACTAVMLYFAFGRQALAERSLRKKVVAQAIVGNKAAISMLKSFSIRFEERDKKLIEAALDGNENAIEVLRLKDKNGWRD